MEEDMCTEKYGSEFTEAVKTIKSDDDGNIEPPEPKLPSKTDENNTVGMMI